MGLSGGSTVYEHFRHLAPGAFVFVAGSAEELRKLEADKSMRGCVLARDTLPDVLRFDALFADYSSMLMSTIAYAQTGGEMAQRVERLVSRGVSESDTRDFVLCFDHPSYVPRVKKIEQDRRRESSSVQPYERVLRLSTGVEYPLDRYVFDEANPMPDDYKRLFRTPLLMDGLQKYIASYLMYHMAPPPLDDPLRLVVCGVPVDGTRTERLTCARLFAPGDDGEPRVTEKPCARIGEAESRCANWLLKYVHDWRGARAPSLCVRSNDSDTLMLLLMCVPRLLAAWKRVRRGREGPLRLWLEYSSPNMKHRRFANVLWLWRAHVRWTQSKLPRDAVHTAPVEMFCAAMMMAGCDYVSSLRRFGPKSVYDAYVKSVELCHDALTFEKSDRARGPWHKDAHNMRFSETALLDFLFAMFCRPPSVLTVLADYGRQMWRRDGRPNRATLIAHAASVLKGKGTLGRFDELSAIIGRTGEYYAKKNAERAAAEARGEKVAGKKLPELPQVLNSEEATAFVRRVLWAVDYYHNASVERSAEPFWQPGDVMYESCSVYGFQPAADGSGALVESKKVVPAHVLEQPFVNRVRRSLKRQRPASVLANSNECLSPNTLAARRKRARELRDSSSGPDINIDFFENDVAHELGSLGIDEHATLLARA